MIESAWITFWKYLLYVGFGSFALLVLFVIPLGARDVFRLFKKLDDNQNNNEEN